MPCDRRLRRGQTISQRKTEIRDSVTKLAKLLAEKKVKPVIGPQGAIAFKGWTEQDRADVSDACAYRQLMVHGSALAKAEIARAEQLAGRSVNKQIIGHGAHSHDGGHTWHDHKG
jgi:hypothetical protein